MPRNPLFLGKIAVLGISGAFLATALSLSQESSTAREKKASQTLVSEHHEHSHEHGAPLRTRKKMAKAKKRYTPRLMAAAAPVKTPYLPVVDHPDIREEHKAIADEVIRLLPAACQKQLKNFYVRYDNPEQRGLAGKSSVVVSGNVPADEFRALLIHEIFGHMLDLGCLRGTALSGPSGFKDGAEVIYQDDPSVAFYSISWTDAHTQKRGAKKADFVTGYAAWDPFEDMAESIAYFVLQEEAFRARAKNNSVLAAKLAWIETHVFQSDISVAAGLHTWNGEVPWDATKLPYVWFGARGGLAQK
ncbi:hypothetical protein HYZ99_04145 [Candidatus Peregrinibacteria bacterium]|nr:hypothetical protein [Candidatus Peregrinibacteria bacterium]